MFRSVGVAVITLLMSAGLVLVPTASQAADGPMRCYSPGKTVWKVHHVSHAVKVGYAKRFYLSPGERVRTIRHVERDMFIKARARFSGGGSIGASGLGKLLAKAEVHVNASLMVFGSYNKASSVTVDRTVVNNTSRNRKFVAFKATQQYRGRFTQRFCQHVPSSYSQWKIDRGTWRTHKSFESGTLRCGAGAPGAVARVVTARHCG